MSRTKIDDSLIHNRDQNALDAARFGDIAGHLRGILRPLVASECPDDEEIERHSENLAWQMAVAWVEFLDLTLRESGKDRLPLGTDLLPGSSSESALDPMAQLGQIFRDAPFGLPGGLRIESVGGHLILRRA